MAKVYANLIIKGVKTISDVRPVALREQVKQILEQRGFAVLIEEA